MSEPCNHNNYSRSFGDCCEENTNHHCNPSKDQHCIVGFCDNCDKMVSHDYGTLTDNHNNEFFDGKPQDTVLAQQFRDIIHFGGASDALDSVPKKCESCGIEVPKDLPEDHLGMCEDCAYKFYYPSDNEEEENGYRCRVCGKWSETDEENMNHTCFEE